MKRKVKNCDGNDLQTSAVLLMRALVVFLDLERPTSIKAKPSIIAGQMDHDPADEKYF